MIVNFSGSAKRTLCFKRSTSPLRESPQLYPKQYVVSKLLNSTLKPVRNHSQVSNNSFNASVPFKSIQRHGIALSDRKYLSKSIKKLRQGKPLITICPVPSTPSQNARIAAWIKPMFNSYLISSDVSPKNEATQELIQQIKNNNEIAAGQPKNYIKISDENKDWVTTCI